MKDKRLIRIEQKDAERKLRLGHYQRLIESDDKRKYRNG